MIKSYVAVRDLAKEYDVDLRMAAYVISIKRIAAAMERKRLDN